jgi:hypothetical protein
VASGAAAVPGAEVAWAKIRAEWQRDQEDNVMALGIVTAAEGGWTNEELQERAGRSQATRLLTSIAVETAAKTAWPPKVIAIGRVLAHGLSAEEDEIDVAQYTLAAMAEMERIHVELLKLLVNFRPYLRVTADGEYTVEAVPFPIERRVENALHGGELEWDIGLRRWAEIDILIARPKLQPVLVGITGTLDRFGLVSSSDQMPEMLRKVAQQWDELQRLEAAAASRSGRDRSIPKRPVKRHMERIWSPTELGEQVLGFYVEAAAEADAEHEASTDPAGNG